MNLKQAIDLHGGGPGSGRRPSGTTSRTGRKGIPWASKHGSMEELAHQHKNHDGMCNLNDPVCRAYVDMKEEHPGFIPRGKK